MLSMAQLRWSPKDLNLLKWTAAPISRAMSQVRSLLPLSST
jgi:hypothetical protein